MNEKMTGYIVQALTDIPPVTRNGRLAGAVDEDGFLDLQLASVHAHLGSVEGETVLRTAALGLTPEAAQVVGGVPMNVVREAVIGARPPHPHDMIAITARSAAAAMPRSDAELRLHSDAAPFVQCVALRAWCRGVCAHVSTLQVPQRTICARLGWATSI